MDNNNKNYEIEVLQKLSRIETLLEDYKSVVTKSNEAYAISMQNKEEIDELKENHQWIFRTSVTAILGAVLSLITTVVVNFIRK